MRNSLRSIATAVLIMGTTIGSGSIVSRADDGPAAPRANVQLAETAESSRALLTQSMEAGKAYVSDLETGNGATVVRGASDKPLPAGRYRLHVPVALSPIGDIKTATIAITVTAGGVKRTVGALFFPVANEFIDVPVDFVSGGNGGGGAFSVDWAFSGDDAKKLARHSVDLSTLDPEGDDNAVGSGGAALTLDASGMANTKTIAGIKYHLAVATPHIEALCPIEVNDVVTDKLVYKPGEDGSATATLKNDSDATQSVSVNVAIQNGIVNTIPVSAQTVSLGAGEAKTINVPFKPGDLRWGAELQVSAKVGNGPSAMAGDVFAVTDNFWKVVMCGGINYSEPYVDAAAVEARVKHWRDNYDTCFESGFWAPDEFGDFTPNTEKFISGQMEYRGSVSGTKNIISAAHKIGISATVYSDLWGGDGNDGFEFVRKHPDWAYASTFSTAWLEAWPVEKANLIPEGGVWPLTIIKGDKGMAPFDHHADEFIASHKMFGWDGTRYDSYGTDPWIIKCTGYVRDRVEKSVPTYHWGYNTSIPHDEEDGAMDTMLHGGQLSMEESVRSIAGQPESFSRYIEILSRYRDLVWGHAGNFCVCYDEPGLEGEKFPLDEMYLSSFILASGTHPYYGIMESGYNNYPRFALRYSEYLWDDTMRGLKEPEKLVHFKGPDFCQWKRLVRVKDLGGDRHRIIVHFINPPTDDSSLHNFAAKTPPVVRNLDLGLTLPADAKVTSAHALNPWRDSSPISLKASKNGADTQVTIPEIRIWNMVVIDYTSAQAL